MPAPSRRLNSPHRLDAMRRTGFGWWVMIVFLVAGTSPANAATYDVASTEIASGFVKPIGVYAAPGLDDRLFVIEQAGSVKMLKRSNRGITTLLTLAVKAGSSYPEMGLLGLAFHPDFAQNGHLFVNCTRDGAAAGDTTSAAAGHSEIIRYTVDDPANPTSAGSAKLIIAFNQPQINHNAGALEFGNDGKLYIGTGDGGGSNDQHGAIGNAQDRTKLLGKMLRIDVDAGATYSIPTDNPYASHATFRKEIWCYGIRNPWRFSFDTATNDLWIGDVGQFDREEVDVVPAGQKGLNFGWRVREGSIQNPFYPSESAVTAITDPIVEFGQPDDLSHAIIGGYVYRGMAVPSLRGKYIYADYAGAAGARFWVLDFTRSTSAPYVSTRVSTTEVTAQVNAGNKMGSMYSFGRDNAGEIYCVGSTNGRIYQLVSGDTVASVTTTTLAADTVNTAYSVTLSAIGGTAPYSWSVVAGALPTGLSLSSSGVISGTSTSSGVASFTVKATPANGTAGTRALSLTINPAVVVTTTSPLLGGTTGVAFSQTLASTGGTGSRTYGKSSGVLPAGTSLSSAGVVSGTPTAAGTSSFTVTVVDATGATGSKPFTWVISPAGAQTPPVIKTTPPLRVPLGTTYSYDVNTDGNPAVTYALGAKPTGMIINATSGIITWTPTTTGPFAVTVTATNGVPPDATQSWTIEAHDHGLNQRPLAGAHLGMSSTSSSASPMHISQTGIFSNPAALTPAAALIPYTVNAPFWSDNASKKRWLAVPSDGSPYDASETVAFSATGEWTFPVGTVFVKHFDLDLNEGSAVTLRRLETRVLVSKAGGGVYGVTYRWNAAATEATRIDVATTEILTITNASGGTRSQTWLYPSPNDCLVCHTANAGFVLGVNTRQLNKDQTYASGVSDHQLRTLGYIGLFDAAPSDATIAACRLLSTATDSNASLEQRARSYLDANCAQCHRPGSGLLASFDARYDTPLAGQGLINGTVTNTLGISDAALVRPGDTALSILHHRVNTSDVTIRMPPLGRYTIDAIGQGLLADWINDLGLPSSTWSSRDIGPVWSPGWLTESGGVWSQRAQGGNLAGTNDDQLYFSYRRLTGDGSITARVTDITGGIGPGSSWNKAGVMMRASTATNSAYAYMTSTLSEGQVCYSRANAGAGLVKTRGSMVARPRWIRLARVGNVITASESANQTTWTVVKNTTIAFEANVLIGLAIAGDLEGSTVTATYTDVVVTGLVSVAN